MKIGFVIPARLKSTRLPRKNLIRIGEQTALEWAIDRARAAKSIDEVVVATTYLNSDADITMACVNKGIRYFLGDPIDVLKRIRDAAEFFDFDYVVNITPDNTLFSMHLIDLMCAEIKRNPQADYLRFKDAMLGIGIYGLKREALEAVCEFKAVVDTEIWGSLFHEKYFNVVDIDLPDMYKADYRLTMDTQEDYMMISSIYRGLKISTNNLVELIDIIKFLDVNPEIASLNSNVRQVAVPDDIIESIRSRFEKHESEFYTIKKKYYRI